MTWNSDVAKVLVAGEALIDLAISPDGSLAAHPGGGPYNVARTIGRLGQPVAFLGSISTDRFGRDLIDELLADGVDVGCVAVTDAPTTLALAELDAAGTASYRFYSEGTAAPRLSTEHTAAARGGDVPIFYLGTLGLVFEPLAAALEAFAVSSPATTMIALDPNCRPHAITDSTAVRARIARLQVRADVIKLSTDDLAWLAPREQSIPAARAMLRRDPSVALVTLGGEGAVIVTREDAIHVPAPRVEVVDTIGAGDVFMGAFIAFWHSQGFGQRELAESEHLEAAVESACSVAAQACSRAGVDPPRAALS